jgi:4-hydroxy-tetrahydrodipicolinate reductase
MKIAVNGAAGAMGRRVVGVVAGADDCRLVAALERSGHPELGRDAGLVAGQGELGVPIADELTAEADALIDFSSPEATVARARQCAEAGAALVIGTTGLSDGQLAELSGHLAERVPVLIASNMSVGINLLFRLIQRVARALPAGYDVEIVEAHHRRKKDAPSGTALEMARQLRDALDRPEDVLVYGRRGAVGPRKPSEIGIHAVRGGDIVGDHTIIFAGEGERLELTHRAGSRDIFARGALQAARFLVGKPAGVYSMADVLG